MASSISSSMSCIREGARWFLGATGSSTLLEEEGQGNQQLAKIVDIGSPEFAESERACISVSASDAARNGAGWLCTPAHGWVRSPGLGRYWPAAPFAISPQGRA